jgi:glycosyltransferase involved in cell wall biosynthesis
VAQEFQDFEVVICEDYSPERQQIAAVVREYKSRYSSKLRYFENEVNLGYDGNVRNLVNRAEGEFCFFMGNDDVMCPGALGTAASIVHRYSNVGIILKSYGWFDETPDQVNQEVRWFKEEREFAAGAPAIRFAFRRSGVLAGYVVHRDTANEAATEKFDGTLYYQMHLTANVLINKTAVCTPKVLVLCRGNGTPDFGNSGKEKGKYVPGGYTSQARLNMISGALSIVEDLKQSKGIDVVEDVIHDYANYFYPYIKDQLSLPLREYYELYRAYGRLGFARYPLYHVYFLVGYILGEKRFDFLTGIVRRQLGRTPRLGHLY